MKITETCSCGASYEIESESRWFCEARDSAAAWRRNHKHQPEQEEMQRETQQDDPLV